MKIELSQFRRTTIGLGDAILAVLYPTSCRVCGVIIESWRNGVACERCWHEAELRQVNNDHCIKCGIPLAPLPSYITTDERRCGRCDQQAFTLARTCGIYEGAIRESVLWLKRHPQIAPRLSDLLRTAFLNLSREQQVDSIVPVPMHPNRLAERTFNQSEIIARKLAAISGLRMDSASLVRARHTEKHRAGMAVRERARSLEKAFRVRAPRLIKGKALLLVDDVMTTGSTADAISQTLLDGGARSVHVLTLARAASEFLL